MIHTISNRFKWIGELTDSKDAAIDELISQAVN